MSEPALSLQFFDPEHGLSGIARTSTTLLFEGSSSSVLPDGATIEADGSGWRAVLEGAFDLTLEPLAEAAPLGPGIQAHVCAAAGTVGARKVSCLATLGETREAPPWSELDMLRSISVLLDREDAVLALARRPHGAPGHGDELTVGWILQAGVATTVEDTRISTVYDKDGRQRSAGLELWLPGEEFPRRCAGSVVAGSSLELEGLAVHAAVFRWRMNDREGLGAYELMVRSEPAAA